MPPVEAPPAPAAAPAAPAPAAAPASKPAPRAIPPEPTGAPTPQEANAFGDAFSELDKIDKAPPEQPKTKSEKAAAKAAAAKAEASKVVKPPEAQKEVTPPAVAPVPKTKEENIAELRTSRDTIKAEKATLETELTTLRTKVQELETRQAEDPKPLKDSIEKLTKERDDLLTEIRYVNYAKHPEFVEKYQKPYQEAWEKATSEIGQLSIKAADGSTRKATTDDILALANAPLDQLDALAEAWFGRSSARVIRHVEKIRDLSDAQAKALVDARQQGTNHFEQQTKQAKDAEAAIGGAYETSKKSLVEKYPRWFAPIEGDAEGNTLLEKGFAYFDPVFKTDAQLVKEGQQPLKPDQRAARLAVIRGKAANHDRVIAREKKHLARIAELETALKEFEDSEPGGGRGKVPKSGGGGGGTFLADANSEIDSLDKPD